MTSVPCGAPVGAGRGCSIGRRRAPALGKNRRPLGLPGRACPLRGAARPRPRRRGRAAATAGDARSRGPSGAAAPRPGLSCLPQSLCLLHTGRSASAPQASNRAAPLVRPTTTTGLAMDRSVAGECLLVSYGTLAACQVLLGTYRESYEQKTRPRSRKRASEAALTNDQSIKHETLRCLASQGALSGVSAWPGWHRSPPGGSRA